MDKKVILISIDGLRPDAVETCGHPFVNTLRENGCYSPDASSVVPPVTLPAHTSIFYSVPPIRHGIITNDYMPPVRPIRGLAEQLERADKTCAAFYGWEPMRHVWTSGNMKYSLFVNEYEEDNSDLLLTQEALSLIERKEPDFVYLYLVETDDKGGHDHGWMTSEYMHRVNNAFSCVQQVYEAVHDRYSCMDLPCLTSPRRLQILWGFRRCESGKERRYWKNWVDIYPENLLMCSKEVIEV